MLSSDQSYVAFAALVGVAVGRVVVASGCAPAVDLVAKIVHSTQN